LLRLIYKISASVTTPEHLYVTLVDWVIRQTEPVSILNK
jgi:hypothetical protein